MGATDPRRCGAEEEATPLGFVLAEGPDLRMPVDFDGGFGAVVVFLTTLWVVEALIDAMVSDLL